MLHQTWTSNIRPLVIMYYNSYLMMVLMYVFFYHSPMKDNWSTFFLLKIILIKFKKILFLIVVSALQQIF